MPLAPLLGHRTSDAHGKCAGQRHLIFGANKK